MTLIKTSVFSFFVVMAKIVSNLVINKAVSIYLGPSGLALIGQFKSFSQVAMTIAQGGINNGITKYTAEYKETEKRSVLFSTAGKISLFSSITTGLAIIIGSEYISMYFLKSDKYSYLLLMFGFTITLFVINSLLLSVLNGLKEIKTWAIINVLQSVYNLVLTTLLIVWLGLDGALIALATNQSVVFLVALWIMRKGSIVQFRSFKARFCTQEAKKLAKFAIMGIVAAIMAPMSHLVVRSYVGEGLGWDAAGYWQAM